VNLLIPGGGSVDRDRTQDVPAAAPAGLYTYDGYVGVYPNDVWDDDHFDFEKLGASDGGIPISDWTNWGEGFEQIVGFGESDLPSGFALLGNYPNPFNPITVLSFRLHDASRVNLSVYDVSGRKVTDLVNGWRDGGVHEVTFEGSELSSGIYLYQLRAGEFSTCGKMVLMK
jgi:hypothetical protein